jgi:arylsulfatase A-like enzyme
MEESGHSSPLARLAEACAVALCGALICALPTALRARAAGGELLDSMLAAVAVMLCVLTPLALLLPKAARGWRGVVGQTTPRKLVVGLLLWVALSGTLFMLLGSFLKASTHHRGLGGATFGVFAALSSLVIAVLVARGVTVADPLHERAAWRWPLRVLGALVVFGALLLIGLPLLRADEGGGALARAAIFDVLLAAVVASLLLTRRPPKTLIGIARTTALPITLCIAVLGFIRVETSNAAEAIKTGGGAVATILGALEAWTDRDGDGMGSHFGGKDCDEGDPHRRPGAQDVAGDGIDYDCDGSDTAAGAGHTVATAEPTPADVATADSAPTVVASAPTSPKQPDIIIVTLDTVRADHTSAYGYEKKTTPNLDALAARGIVFEHAYAAGSDTQRALTPILSGTTMSATPHTNKEWPRIREEANTVAERMKAAGYTTGGVSSFTWVRKDRGFAQGFDVLDQSAWAERHPEREVTGDLAIQAAIRLYQQMSAGSSPLYLWVHLFDAHNKHLKHPGIDFGKGSVATYDGEIAFVDQQLGKLVDAVSKGKRGQRTLWVVHGSHGEAFGEHGQTGHGTQLYDESIRVPLVIATPSGKAGRHDGNAVSVLDIAPTLLDMAGASSAAVTGVSLRAVLEGETFERAPVFAYANRRVAVLDWPLKLHVFQRKERRDRLILFDLSKDPGEEKDISGDDKDALVKLDTIRRKAEETGSDN